MHFVLNSIIMDKIKILFFTPYAGRTGSEMALLNFLKHIDQTKFDVRLFSMQNGELLKELPSSIKSYVDKSNSSIVKRIVNKVISKLQFTSSLERRLLKINHEFKPDIWYLNTMVMPIIVDIAIKNNIKFAVHFHELLSQYNFITADNLERAIEHSSFTIGCCDVVCESLKILGSKKVLKQYECIDTNLIKVNEHRKTELRLLNNILEGSNIIVMSGQRIDRKGYDIFIEVARRLKDEKYYFIWLGATKQSGYEYFLDKYIDHYKLKNILIIHPPQLDYYNYLDLADVFFLSSREDPFPLVMLEANILGKYIVSLDSGGVVEFLDSSKGHIIKSWNIEDIVSELKMCCHNLKDKKISPIVKSEELEVETQTKLFELLLQNSIINISL